MPLWQELATSNPIFPGDPEFTVRIATTIAQAGYQVEQLSLGTHTGTHLDAPAHFIEGGLTVAQLDERLALLPLAVIDLRDRAGDGRSVDPGLGVDDLQAWERAHGRFPDGGCVLLLTGFGALFGQDAYVDPAPGLTGEAMSWLVRQRGVIAAGSDSFGPDAGSDRGYSATRAMLAAGGVTVANVGPGLAQLRPHGDWIAINGPRPHFSGIQVGLTGFTR